MRSLSLIVPLLAAVLFAAAPAAGEDAYRQALARGEELLARGELKAAIKALRKAHELAPAGTFECCYRLAETYGRTGAFEKAVDSARAAVAAAPGPQERLQARNVLGLSLFAGGTAGKAELEEAARVFGEILEEAPLGTARLNLGVTLLKLERDAEGIAMLEQFLAENPAAPEARLARSYVDEPRRAREDLVPAFEAVTLEGEILTPEDFAGKVLLIDFWGTWCAPCIASIPHLRRLARWSEKSPFVLLSVSNDDDGETLRRFVAEHELSWPQVWDEDRELTERIFEVRHYPTFLLVDHQGVVRYRESGWGEPIAEALDSKVASAIRAAKKAAKGR